MWRKLSIPLVLVTSLLFAEALKEDSNNVVEVKDHQQNDENVQKANKGSVKSSLRKGRKLPHSSTAAQRFHQEHNNRMNSNQEDGSFASYGKRLLQSCDPTLTIFILLLSIRTLMSFVGSENDIVPFVPIPNVPTQNITIEVKAP